MWKVFWSVYHQLMNNLGADAGSRYGIQIVQIGLCSPHDINVFTRIENNDSVGTSSGHDMVAIDKFTRHIPENFPFFHRVAISFRRLQLCLQAGSRMIWRCSSPSCLGEPSVHRNMNAPCNLPIPNSLDLKSMDVKIWRDVALNVVPVRDGQVVNPTSSRFQILSSANSWKHLCTKLMRTTFVIRRDWKNNLQRQAVSLGHQTEFQILYHTATFYRPVCLVFFAMKQKQSSPLSTAFFEDPTSPEVQRYLQQVSYAYVQLTAVNGNFLWRFCDVLIDSIHNANQWNCLVIKTGIRHDINTITSFVRIDFHIQDWADFLILTNPPLQISRLCVFSTCCLHNLRHPFYCNEELSSPSFL